MRRIFQLFCLLFGLFYANSDRAVVLIGGTGDLARKYLWNAIFHEIFLQDTTGVTRFFGASRRTIEVGSNDLHTILSVAVRCENDHCISSRTRFGDDVVYVQLKEAEHFKNFCDVSTSGFDFDELTFYLSIPPDSILNTLRNIKNFCLGRANTTIVLEKPFGSNKAEVGEILGFLESHVHRSNVFLVDHYLAKDVILYLPEFFEINKSILTNFRLAGIELVTKETDAVPAERLAYYDSYGIVKDMLLSHLTALFIRTGPHFCDKHTYDVLSSVSWTNDSIFLAQHVDYAKLSEFQSKTPTFAEFGFEFTSRAFEKVPVVMKSGKYMTSKLSFMKFLLENSVHETAELIFLINPSGAVIWSENLAGIQIQTSENSMNSDFCRKFSENLALKYACGSYKMFSLKSTVRDTYRNVIREIMKIDRKSEVFMTFEEVRSIWDFWEPILEISVNLPLQKYVTEQDLPSEKRRNVPKIEL